MFNECKERRLSNYIFIFKTKLFCMCLSEIKYIYSIYSCNIHGNLHAPPCTSTQSKPALSHVQVCVFLYVGTGVMRSKDHVHDSFHSHWRTIVEFLNGLVVNSDGYLSISIEGKLNVVAASALPHLVPRQLHVFATSANTISVFITDQNRFIICILSGWRSHLTSRRVSLRMLMRLRRVFTGS